MDPSGDPFAQLESCHRKLEERMAALARCPGDDDAREDFLAYVARSIGRHESDEEESLFPRLAGAAELEDTLESLRAEHRAHAALHTALREARDEASAITALDALRAAYAEHIRIEESVLFPAARRTLSEIAKTELMNEMQARRGRGGGGGGRPER